VTCRPARAAGVGFRGVSSGSQGRRGADGHHGPVRIARRVQIIDAGAEEAEVSARAMPTASGDHHSGLQLGPQEATAWDEGTLSDS
jgi:hypothetical protein